jgi:hypothetical protein
MVPRVTPHHAAGRNYEISSPPSGTPVSEDYQVSFKFIGELKKVVKSFPRTRNHSKPANRFKRLLVDSTPLR